MQDSDWKARYPANRTNTSAHGGRMSTDRITSGAEANVFANLSSEERAAGKIEYKKIFPIPEDATNPKLVVVKAWVDRPCEGDDWGTIFAGTQTDTLADITGWETGADSKTKSGTAWVTTDVVAGTKTIKVTVDNAKLLPAAVDAIFRASVSQKCKLSDGSNSEEVVIDTLAVSGLEITATTVDNITRNYSAGTADARVSRLSSILEIGTVEPTAEEIGYTGGANYDLANFPPLLDDIGTLEVVVVFTFGDAANFTAACDAFGISGSGTVNDDFTLTNTALSKTLATFYAAGWSGLTIAGGDTYTCRLHPAGIPIWEKREAPAGMASTSWSDMPLKVSGEVSA